ncbi:MAG: hypothetical protein IPJ46_08300 [Anaerolineales bacterium]|jgi:hypothetical protein|nr:hypothetical protein [Anaerolineales bacterium]
MLERPHRSTKRPHAFIVCENFEIETNAPNYLAHWSSPEQIKESGQKNYQVRQPDH